MTASRPLAYAREGVQLNREFPNAYQGKFFKEQGIGKLISGAAADPAETCPPLRSMSAYWGKADSR